MAALENTYRHAAFQYLPYADAVKFIEVCKANYAVSLMEHDGWFREKKVCLSDYEKYKALCPNMRTFQFNTLELFHEDSERFFFLFKLCLCEVNLVCLCPVTPWEYTVLKMVYFDTRKTLEKKTRCAFKWVVLENECRYDDLAFKMQFEGILHGGDSVSQSANVMYNQFTNRCFETRLIEGVRGVQRGVLSLPNNCLGLGVNAGKLDCFLRNDKPVFNGNARYEISKRSYALTQNNEVYYFSEPYKSREGEKKTGTPVISVIERFDRVMRFAERSFTRLHLNCAVWASKA